LADPTRGKGNLLGRFLRLKFPTFYTRGYGLKKFGELIHSPYEIYTSKGIFYLFIFFDF